jgi:hypothetical protein
LWNLQPNRYPTGNHRKQFGQQTHGKKGIIKIADRFFEEKESTVSP